MKGFTFDQILSFYETDVALGKKIDIRALLEIIKIKQSELTEEIIGLKEDLDNNNASSDAYQAQRDAEHLQKVAENKAYQLKNGMEQIERSLREVIASLRNDRLTKKNRLWLSASIERLLNEFNNG